MTNPMPDSSGADRILCACTNLKIASRATARVYDRALARHELTTMQYAIIVNLARSGQMASTALADRLSIERTALYRAVAVLERRKLVQARPGRGRERILSLTEAGLSLRDQALKDWATTQKAFIERFGPDWPDFLALLDRARAVSDQLSEAGVAD